MPENAAAGAAVDWESHVGQLNFVSNPFIGGKFVSSDSDVRFPTINPATGEAICEVPSGSAGDVDRAVAVARAAFEDGRWSTLSPAKRRAALLRLADLVERNRDELALLDSIEMGKAITHAHNEIAMSTGLLRYCAESIDKLYGSLAPSDANVLAFTTLEPRGVVGAIVPWNFPLVNTVIKAAPALAVGNTMVLKPSELASLSSLRFADIALQAGIPPGVFNVVPGLGGTVGQAIGLHQDIDFLSFTGSTATGRKLLTYAGQSNGKPTMMELGGKSPQIVCAEFADEIEPLAAQIVHSAFWNQGQWCAARTFLIVEDTLYDSLLDAVADGARRLIPGNPLDPSTNFGTIASDVQFARVRSYIESGRSEGARIILQGSAGRPCALSLAPWIFGDVSPDMTIAREEIFGPVLAVARFHSFEQALAMANASGYGLGATVWTRDSRRTQMAVRRLRAGKIMVKATAKTGGGSGLALGGEPWGASGYGAERGIEGMRSYCRGKGVELLA